MTETYEIRTDDALTILVEGTSQNDALGEAASKGLLTAGDTGSIEEYDGRPVGMDGTDPA